MKPQATRQAFGEALLALGESYPRIVVLDADLSKSTKSDLFAQRYPHRFFQMGIAEANLIGTAAGLAFAGLLPFACSFGCFLTGRYDTIRLSVAYSQANVRLVGTHAGIGIGDDGYSQMGLEDVALMRALPQMGVFQPMDDWETRALMEHLVSQWQGPAYLRLTRQALPRLSDPQFDWKVTHMHPVCPLEPLAAPVTRVLCLATGATVAQAIEARQELRNQNRDLCVWNVHCLKPFDYRTLRGLLQERWDLILSVEDHSIIGGLGSIVAETLAEMPQHGASLRRLGIQDVFGQSGPAAELYAHYGIDARAIVQAVR